MDVFMLTAHGFDSQLQVPKAEPTLRGQTQGYAQLCDSHTVQTYLSSNVRPLAAVPVA